ncbi:MAG: PLP-dependent cysteine synthase family protein, partial [Methanobacteriaceae archaeon]
FAVFGVDIVLTPGIEGMNGAIKKVEELLENYNNSYTFNQFKNPTNIETHYKTTANEIWRDCGGKIDIVIAGVGTGGTISGIAKNLKEKDKNIKFIGVEPSESPVLSGGKANPHKIQGIGAGFIPENFKKDYIDEIITVSDENASKTMLKLAKSEGIFAGISSGAALYAALELAKKDINEDNNTDNSSSINNNNNNNNNSNKKTDIKNRNINESKNNENRNENINKRILVILPDTGERYLSMDWVFEDIFKKYKDIF